MEENNHNNDRRTRMQLMLAAAVTMSGVVLMIAGFVVSPLGKIDSSVLVAFGECLTFGGTLLGVVKVRN